MQTRILQTEFALTYAAIGVLRALYAGAMALVAGHMAHPAAIPGALGVSIQGQDAHPVLSRLRTVASPRRSGVGAVRHGDVERYRAVA
jgi:hypothetical protein